MPEERVPHKAKEELLAAVREAGDLLLSLWPGAPGSPGELEVAQKRDGTLVSKADLASNEILMRALHKLFPGDAILSEEVHPDRGILAESPRTWVIDPLDGTKCFLNGEDQFSLLLALCERGEPVFGVQLFPARSQLVVAEKGRGARVNGAVMQVSGESQSRRSHVYLRNFEGRRPELASPMMDSGQAFFRVATGALDGAVIRMNTLGEWDIAAPIVAIQEAGGRVSDEGGREVKCGLGTLNIQYLIASNGLNHSELLSLIP